MKKLLIFSAVIIALSSCNNGSSDSNAIDGDTTSAKGITNPSAIDTTQHPNGITNGDVISTDTAAMNVQNSINKGKAAASKKNK